MGRGHEEVQVLCTKRDVNAGRSKARSVLHSPNHFYKQYRVGMHTWHTRVAHTHHTHITHTLPHEAHKNARHKPHATTAANETSQL